MNKIETIKRLFFDYTKKHIKKIAVIGSGIMGSGIACHYANIGVEVLLDELDIATLIVNGLGFTKLFDLE